MTDPELQIAVAKACGWTTIDDGAAVSWYDPKGFFEGRSYPDYHFGGLPYYTASHDAMAEALGTMTEEEWWKYLRFLAIDFGGSLDSWSPALLRATPRQQAVAFLKATNLYNPSQQ